ncbi:polysaccharide biosynthesis C-terminal domain-containing protein [Bacillus sp. S13(2024)]|uniref:lipopolysaccharide biosynthesis protein n=1 Tax=unclassified Bacillus (in: firmicutes) TaxID=185979 RepID=UPI003D1D0192
MRTKKAFYNFCVAIMLQLITIILGFLIIPIRIQTYGSEMNGLLASIGQFLVYFKLVEAGISIASMQALYKPLANNDTSQVNAILSATKQFYNRAGIIFTIIVVIFSILFPIVTKGEISGFTVTALVIVMAGSGILEFLIFNKYGVLLAADQKDYIVNFIQVIISVLNATISIVLMYLNKSILLVTIWSTSASVLKVMIIVLYFKKYYPEIKFNTIPNYEAISKRWDAFIHQLASLVVFNSPIIIITFFCSLKVVSIYSVYNVIFAAIGSIIGVFSSGLLAGFGQAMTINNQESVRKSYSSFECLYYMVLTWAYTCCLILILPFVRIYTKGIHDANYIDPVLAILFVWVGMSNQIRIPQNMLVSAAGHFKETRKRAIIEACINIIASLVFVQYFGVYGVLMGSICSFTYRTIDFVIYGNRHILNQSPLKSFQRIIINIVLGVTSLFFFYRFSHVNSSGWIDWGLQAIIISIVIMLVIVSGNMIFERVVMIDIVKRIKVIMKR